MPTLMSDLKVRPPSCHADLDTQCRRRGAWKTGRQGKHKSQIYNILGEMGQTGLGRAASCTRAYGAWVFIPVEGRRE
jgi:hypothetical protein